MPPSLRKLKSAVTWFKRSPHLLLKKTRSEIRRRSGWAPVEAETIKLGDVSAFEPVLSLFAQLEQAARENAHC
jgi:hypothetical protein